MDQYLQDLIDRMGAKETYSNSADSISFAAHREAENLEDSKYIEQIIDFIKSKNKPKEKKERNHAYYILGKLLIKHGKQEAIEFFIEQLRFETDKYILGNMLDRLAVIQKSKNVDITPIVELTKNEKWLIRHSAIGALKKSESPLAIQTAKSIILGFKDMKKYKYEITYANSVLSDIGTKEEIEILNPLLTSKIRDIKDSAKFAIDKINERNK